LSLGTAPWSLERTSRKTRSTLNSSRLVDSNFKWLKWNDNETRFVEFRRVPSSFVDSLAKLGALILFREDSESLASMGRVEGFLCDSNWVVSEIRSMPSVTCCPCDREQENGHIGQDISKAVTSFHKQILPTSTLYHQYLSSTHIIIIIYIILYHTKYIIYTTYVISTLTCFRNRESFCPGDSRNLSVASGYSLRPWPRWPRIKPSPATVCASLIVVLVFHHLEIIFPRLLTRIDDRMEKRPSRGVMTGRDGDVSVFCMRPNTKCIQIPGFKVNMVNHRTPTAQLYVFSRCP
jgi:hypothetical protein